MPDLIKVAKFGGTSVADAAAMTRCAKIVSDDPDKRIVVLSATSGTTNLLVALSSIHGRSDREDMLKTIEEKHLKIAEELESSEETVRRIREILEELRDVANDENRSELKIKDRLLSFGEQLSTTIFTDLLQRSGVEAELLDSRDVIRTDSTFGNAEPLLDEIRKEAAKRIAPNLRKKRMVTQGFIGSDRNGTTTTLGRGGSDFTAALLAEALDADVLEIWTDVDAIYSTDPRIVPEAKPITELTFDEAAELSTFGAKVLHPATLKPAIRKNIRVYVGSSIHPEKPGTWIVKRSENLPVTRAISLRMDQTLLTVHSLDMLHRHGFLARLFQILADHKISVDLVTTSEVSVSLTIDTNHEGLRQRLSSGLMKDLEAIADVQVETGLVLIAVVGNHLDRTAGVSGELFQLLDEINIRLVCHGASSHNLCFLVEEQRAKEVVQRLHDHFITNKGEVLA